MELLARIRGLLAPPARDYADEDEARVASTVHKIGLALVPNALLIAAALWISLANPWPLLRLDAVLIALVLVALLLVRFGRARAAARVIVGGNWLCFAMGYWVSRGAPVTVGSGLVLSIAAGAVLLRPGSAYLIAALSALVAPSYAITTYLTGWPTHWGQPLPLGIWLTQGLIYFAAAALVSIAVRHGAESHALARQNEARFRAISDNAPDMITELDDQGRLLYANPSALARAGRVMVDETGGKRLDYWMHPADYPKVMERCGRLLANGGVERIAYRTLDDTGAAGWLESTGAAYKDRKGRTRVVTLTRDVTRQREVEALLRDSVERYRLLVENFPDMIFEFNSAGRITYANPSALATLGRELADFATLPRGAVAHPDDVAASIAKVDAIAAGGGTGRLVHRLLTRDGTPVWVASCGTRYVKASGEVHVIAQSHDLTAELALQEQLREAQKMDAIGRLAGGVAHDFNNLLTVIGGYASVLEGTLQGAAATAAHEISDATARAAALTNQLLLLSRRQLSQPSVVDLNAAIRGIEPILRRTLPERLELELSLDPDLPAIEIDPPYVDQVMLNLTLNARDAIPGSGTLRIETRPGQGGRFAHLVVSDTGQGMDEATRARAFEPFFTTKPLGSGTGLGLATTYGIVRQCGGSIALESEPGSGTRVEISLPASASRPSVAPRAVAPTLPVARRDTSVLLVEDDASVRRLLAIMLESKGFRVTAAGDATEALSVVASSQRKFDLLISDYVMPGPSGVELARQLRERWPDLAVLLMTGYAEISGTEVGSLPRGAEILGKPFTREQLQQTVARLVETA